MPEAVNASRYPGTNNLLLCIRFWHQFVIKSERALKRIAPIERYYISAPKREDCRKELIKRSYEIDTKLKIVKREFKNGLYIEELLK